MTFDQHSKVIAIMCAIFTIIFYASLGFKIRYAAARKLDFHFRFGGMHIFHINSLMCALR